MYGMHGWGGGFPGIWMIVFFAIIVIGLFQLAKRRHSPHFSHFDKNSSCQKCNQPIHEAFLNCPNCGTSLKEHCTHCSALIKSEWSFCPQCGKPRATLEDRQKPVEGIDHE
jgi:RNA polymerase subunit RPABC4/transcription elongation factor Spt4